MTVDVFQPEPEVVDVIQPEDESGEEDGAQAVVSLCAADEELVQAVAVMDLEILSVIHQLGVDSKKYKRERNKQLKYLISEIYSGPRVVRALKLLPGLGLGPGFSLDLTTVDENGDNWDFNDPAMRAKAERLVDEQEPYCLIGSPACTP